MTQWNNITLEILVYQKKWKPTDLMELGVIEQDTIQEALMRIILPEDHQ